MTFITIALGQWQIQMFPVPIGKLNASFEIYLNNNHITYIIICPISITLRRCPSFNIYFLGIDEQPKTNSLAHS